jgi:two-component system sensor histidine kinase/response regulator
MNDHIAKSTDPEERMHRSPNDEPLRIAGIDTNAGLKRLGGKRERYELLLRKFAAQQALTNESIRASLSRGDIAAAERDAHSLKGSAATLGANMLADDAAKAEAAIKSGVEVDAALSSLSQSLDGLIAGIRAVLSE